MSLPHVHIAITSEPYGRPIDARGHPEVHNAIGIVNTLDVSRFPWKLKVRLDRVNIIGPDHVLFDIAIHGWAVDRDEVLPLRIEFPYSRSFPIRREMPEQVRHWLRYCLRETVMHELDECMMFDGVRVFDPHKGES